MFLLSNWLALLSCPTLVICTVM